MKLCPRLHSNPRGAEVCSKCGSRELSTPQPKIPMSWRLLAILARLGIGLMLFYASLALVVALLRSPEVQQSIGCLRNALGRPLVALEQAARLVPGIDPCALEAEGG